MKQYPSSWRYYGLVFAAWIVYILLTFLAPASQNSSHLNLSSAAITILRITLLVPYMLTWLVAVAGWRHFNHFVKEAKRKKILNSDGFYYISRGLGLLIYDLIFTPMFSAARNVWGENKDAAALLTLVSNYSHIAIPLFAFWFLYSGSRKLALSGRYAATIRSRLLPALLPVALFITLFSLAVFNNTSRQVAGESGGFASYYISDVLIVLTIIIPLAVTWFLGLQAVLNTERYMHSLLQPKWRGAIIHFFHGLLAIVSSSIILQAITAFGSQQLQEINLALLLLIIYLFIFMQAAGYIFIRAGAKQLRHLIALGTPHETN